MLQKLKRRFVAITMLLLGIVIVSVYLFILGNAFLSVTNEVENTLKDYVFSRDVELFPSIGIHSDGNNKGKRAFSLYANSVCVVNVTELGNISILDISRVYLADDIIEDAVNAAYSGEEDFGLIKELGLFYYKTQTLLGSRIAFADSSQYFSYLKAILVDGAILVGVALAAFYVISRLLSRFAMRPVEKAWTQQKNFIADASHELKTPLTVILANNNILQTHKADTVSEQMKWIDSTYEEATHMKEIVDDLLMLAKTDNQRHEKLFTEVDLSDMAMKSALQFEPVAFEKGVLLESDIDNGIKIKGDATALNQMLHILIDNAVKYAGEGGKVDISLHRKQSFVYLTTHNSGVPIPPDELPHIFERFYRADKVRTAGNGYGLGLSICKNLAELHKASITAESDEANGTVFTVKFRAEK